MQTHPWTSGKVAPSPCLLEQTRGRPVEGGAEHVHATVPPRRFFFREGALRGRPGVDTTSSRHLVSRRPPSGQSQPEAFRETEKPRDPYAKAPLPRRTRRLVTAAVPRFSLTQRIVVYDRVYEHKKRRAASSRASFLSVYWLVQSYSDLAGAVGVAAPSRFLPPGAGPILAGPPPP